MLMLAHRPFLEETLSEMIMIRSLASQTHIKVHIPYVYIYINGQVMSLY